MEFTFGVCVTENNLHLHDQIIDSIESLNIPKDNYEIIFIGDKKCQNNRVTFIDFNENIVSGWITKKKNFLVDHAKFENIVLMHDYIVFDSTWYSEFEKFGNDFEVCMNSVIEPNGKRSADWLVLHEDFRILGHELLLPYEWTHCTKIQYINGIYWVAKTQFMQNNPLNEFLAWAQGEDVEWSRRVREKIDFKINNNSVVRLLKNKGYNFIELSDQSKEVLRSYGY